MLVVAYIYITYVWSFFNAVIEEHAVPCKLYEHHDLSISPVFMCARTLYQKVNFVMQNKSAAFKLCCSLVLTSHTAEQMYQFWNVCLKSEQS